MFSGKVKRLMVGLSLVGAVCASGVAVGEDEFEWGIQLWDKMIELNPKSAYAYAGRAIAKDALGQTVAGDADRAIAEKLSGQ